GGEGVWGGEVCNGDDGKVGGGCAIGAELLLFGYQLKQTATIQYELLRSPERRLTATVAAGSHAARVWSEPTQGFEKLDGLVEAHWLPRAKGDDYESRWQARAGGAVGQVPFPRLVLP